MVICSWCYGFCLEYGDLPEIFPEHFEVWWKGENNDWDDYRRLDHHQAGLEIARRELRKILPNDLIEKIMKMADYDFLEVIGDLIEDGVQPDKLDEFPNVVWDHPDFEADKSYEFICYVELERNEGHYQAILPVLDELSEEQQALKDEFLVFLSNNPRFDQCKVGYFFNCSKGN